MTPLVLTLTIAAGAVGALVRYVMHAAPSRPRADGRARGLTPPWRILAINVAASFVAGLALPLVPADWAPVIIAGFCGGLSTWSTFMTDALRVWGDGRRLAAVGLVAASIGYGLLAALGGFVLGSLLTG